MTAAGRVTPDLKDWTWVLQRPCPDCGYDAASVRCGDLGRLVRDDAAGWTAILRLSEVARRPSPSVWSAFEYACHVRDVHRIMRERLQLMLDHDEPTFANWDQDSTAVQDAYHRQDPDTVAEQVVVAADSAAAAYDRLADEPESTWSRRGLRSNGSEFTVDSLARYHLHDVVHHAHDVRHLAARATAAAYDVSAAAFAEATDAMGEVVRPRLERFAAAVGGGGRVLEIGSGGGRDAAVLEELGLQVRRTDVATGFVEHLRARGLTADRLDPLHDELVDGDHPSYDGVWANASLLHVARADLPVVLHRLAAATRRDGVLALAVKEGDGEAWSTHGSVTAPRRFTYWRATPLREALIGAGWRLETLTVEHSPYDQRPWLVVQARRGG